MTSGLVGIGTGAADALTALRAYAELAPWSLRDLAAIGAAILEASGVFPVNAAARAHPTERTIRFYVARGLVSPPEGRGTAAIYHYRHLLQVLAIKLRQMDGATLEIIDKDIAGVPGDVIERRVASALGPGLPSPDRLPILRRGGRPRGKVGRARQHWNPEGAGPETGIREGVRETGHGALGEGSLDRPRLLRRVALGPGIELLVDEGHPLARRLSEDPRLTAALRERLADLTVGRDDSRS